MQRRISAVLALSLLFASFSAMPASSNSSARCPKKAGQVVSRVVVNSDGSVICYYKPAKAK